MPRRSQDLHGNAPHESSRALLLIDTINDLEWEGAKALYKRAVTVAQAIARLKARATAAGIPSVYVNDNFGLWRSDFSAKVRHCLSSPHGRPVVQLLRPAPEDYYILKPKHSGFHASPLHLLLEHMKVKELILTGFTTNSCVFFTAMDAYLRDYRLVIPKDCVAASHPKDHEQALQYMERSLGARVLSSRQIRFRKPASLKDHGPAEVSENAMPPE